MDSICRFLPPKAYSGSIRAIHFVYETEFSKMKQPFICPIWYLHLVTSGEAVLHVYGRTYRLQTGTLFFFFPGVPYEIKGDETFRYVYISFMGACVPELLGELGIDLEHGVFQGFSSLTDLWLSSIVRLQRKNAIVLTEGVLLYTLSFLSRGETGDAKNRNSDNLPDVIVDYVDTHFCEKGLTLRAVAAVFAYTEKYLSHLFKQTTGIGFNEYLNRLRLQYAHQLIGEGEKSVSVIAGKCGFSDPLYFSKVFRKHEGCPPREYVKKTSDSIRTVG